MKHSQLIFRPWRRLSVHARIGCVIIAWVSVGTILIGAMASGQVWALPLVFALLIPFGWLSLRIRRPGCGYRVFRRVQRVGQMSAMWPISASVAAASN
jgi:hypothetical protein